MSEPTQAAPGGVGEPTLLELLESTAQGHENLCELGLLPRQHHAEAKGIAQRLRAAAARLREEMASADADGWETCLAVLTRINGGSTPAPTGDEPAGPPEEGAKR